MRRWIAPLCSVLLVLAMAAPAFAGMPDNLGAREFNSYVCTDTTADCGPAVRVGVVQVLGGTTPPFDLSKVAATAVQSGGISNAAPTAGMLDVLAGCRYNASAPTITTTRVNSLQCNVSGALWAQPTGSTGVALLPDAAALADGVSNPTTTSIGAVISARTSGATTNDQLRAVGAGNDGGTTDTSLATFGTLAAYDAIAGKSLKLNTGRDAGDANNGSRYLAVSLEALNGSNTFDEVRSGAQSDVAAATGMLSVLPTCQYNTTLPAITATRFNNTQCDVGGNLKVTSAGYLYSHIAAGQATTVVKGSPGFLHAVCFNSAATATNVTTIYDNASTSGNVIAIPNAVAATVPNCITYDLTTALGIVIITTNANGSDMTVSFR